MISPSQPALCRPDENARAGKQAHQKHPSPSRFTRRRLRSVLPRIIVLAVTLTLLIGIIALVRTANTGVPGSSASALRAARLELGDPSAPDLPGAIFRRDLWASAREAPARYLADKHISWQTQSSPGESDGSEGKG